MIEFKNSKGENLKFDDKPLSKGGEGAVYRQYDTLGHGDIGDLAKVFHNGKADGKENKIKAMLAIKTPMPSSNFAWPKEILYDVNTGEFCGYVMYMKYNKQELGTISAQDSKYRTEKDWKFYVGVAKSLAKTVAGLHEIGQAVGDLNDKNVLVDMESGHVTLIDNDSFHITHNSETYRCCVGMGEYVAPEIQGVNFREAPMPTFTQHTDNFSLAILIFKLLMNGLHPFNSATIDEKSIEENIKNGRSPYFKSENKGKSIEPPYAPPIDILPKKLYKLFKAAFNDSLNSPNKRPSAQDFYDELDSLSKDEALQTCISRGHKYPVETDCCPWCYVNEKMAHLMKGSLSKDFTFGSYAKDQKKINQKAQSKNTPVKKAANVIETDVSPSENNYGDFVPSNIGRSLSSGNSVSAGMIQNQIIPPKPISSGSKAAAIAGCVCLLLLAGAACAVSIIYIMPLIAIAFAVVIIVLAILNLPKIDTNNIYNSIVDFPSYLTIKFKENKKVQYTVVSKYKVLLYNFFVLSAIIALCTAVIMGIKIKIIIALISFAILAVFGTFFITEKRSFWTKTALGIIIGIFSSMIVTAAILMFANLIFKFIGI